MTAATLAALDARIRQHIPLARAAGIVLQAGDGDTLEAHAPAAANGNPHDTVFGGSLYVAALVAGYARTTLLLENAGINRAQVVIQRAEAEYRQPLTGDIVARTEPVPSRARERFLAAMQRRGRGRIDLPVSVVNGRITVFILHTRFAAIIPKRADTSPSCPTTSSAGSHPGSRSTG